MLLAEVDPERFFPLFRADPGVLATDDDPDAGGNALAGGDRGSVLAALVEEDLPPTAGTDAAAASSALGATIAASSGLAAEPPSAPALATPLAAESRWVGPVLLRADAAVAADAKRETASL